MNKDPRMNSASESESMDGSVVCIVRPYNDKTGELGRLEEEIIHRRRNKIDSPTAPPIIEEDGGGEKQKKYESKDFLSGFKTYGDQLDEVSITAPHTKPAKLKSSPKPKKKRTPISLQQDTCSIQNNNIQASQLRSPESQRSTIDNNIMSKVVTQTSPQQHVNKNGSRLCLLGTLRAFVVVWASLTLLSGSVSAFSSKHPNIFEYILASPLLWLVRFYMATFHLVLILVELNVEVPLFVPKRTLTSFLHKGYLISFFGLLDTCLSSNISVDEILQIWSLKSKSEGLRQVASGYELKGVAGWKFLSNRSIINNICRVVLSVSSKGLIICGLLYCSLGLLGWTGESVEQGKNKTTTKDVDRIQHPKSRASIIRRGSLPGDPIIRYET
jgi:hypothetical protein